MDAYASTKANAHFCLRALERHGITVKDEHIRQVILQITERKSEFLKWSHNEGFRAFYRVSIFELPYIVLYDFEIDALVTIYHNSWLKFENGEWIPSRKYRKGIRQGNLKW